jgi:hypothetical protein
MGFVTVDNLPETHYFGKPNKQNHDMVAIIRNYY